MASSAAAVPPEDEVRPFRIRVYRQGIVEQNPIAVEMSLSATVRDLKEKVKDVTSEPTDAQRLIHQGKQLEDDIGLREAFQYHLDDPNPITVHVVIRPPEEASSSSHPVRGFFHSSPSSSRQASGSTSAAASHAGPSRGHAASPLNPNLQPRGGAPQNDPAVNFNEEVTITTTSGSFFPNPNNRPGSTSSFRSGPPGGNGGPSQASRSANSSDSADNQHPPTHSTHTSSFAGTRSNGVYHRIVRTQTHTVRIRHQAHPGGTPSPPGGTAYSTGHSIGPSGTSFQGAHATPAGTSRAPSEPALGTPRAAAPGPRSESAGGTATFAFSNSNSPRADDANAFNTSALYENTNLTPNSFDVPNLPFGAAFPGMPSVDAASASLFGPPAIPEQQYWLLYSPDGPNSLLLSATPPPGPALPRRAPLGPVHLSPPPGWSLNEPLIDPPTLEPTGDLNAREAQLREQIEQTRTANLRRLAALNEQRRHLLDLQQQIANDMAGTQPQPAQQPLQPQAAQPQPQQVAQQQQPALQQLRRNPIEYILDTLAWFFGGNVDPAQPQQQQQQQREGIRNIANLVLDNAWLAVRLIFAVFILGGGRDTRRDLFLWLIFIIIFVWQSGLFDAWLRPMIQRMNELIPDPARPPQQQQPPPPQQHAQQGMQPHDLAQRLMAEHQARQQDGGGIFDTIQNGVSIFLASLVPGLGERIGIARQRERERERRLIEEAAMAQQQGQDGQPAAAAEGGEGQGQAQAQAPGPQDPAVVNAAVEHFGDARAEELFGPQGQDDGQQAQEQGPVDALFGPL